MEEWQIADWENLNALNDANIYEVLKLLDLSGDVTPNETLTNRQGKIVRALNEPNESLSKILSMLPFVLECQTDVKDMESLQKFVCKLSEHFPGNTQIQDCFLGAYYSNKVMKQLVLSWFCAGGCHDIPSGNSQGLGVVLFLTPGVEGGFQCAFYRLNTRSLIDSSSNFHSKTFDSKKSQPLIDCLQEELQGCLGKSFLSRFEVVTTGEIMREHAIESLGLNCPLTHTRVEIASNNEFLYRHIQFIMNPGLQSPGDRHNAFKIAKPEPRQQNTLFIDKDDFSFLENEDLPNIWFSLFVTGRYAEYSSPDWNTLVGDVKNCLKTIQPVYQHFRGGRVVLLYEDPLTTDDVRRLCQDYAKTM